jgi:hypothetical protein
MPHVPLLLLLAAVLLASPHPAEADDQVQDSPAYTEAVTAGVAEFEEKNFLEARARFSRAHALYPNARTLRALGMVSFELKSYVESVRYLSQALGSMERRLEGDKRRQTEKLLESARGYIAQITLQIASDTRVNVDASETDLSSGSELLLDVGDHTLEFSAKGRIADKRTITVHGGEQEMLRVQLAALSKNNVPPASVDERTEERRAYKSPWLWTALGIVVAGAAVGTAVALTRDDGGNQAPPSKSSSGVTLTWKNRDANVEQRRRLGLVACRRRACYGLCRQVLARFGHRGARQRALGLWT